MSDDPFAPPGGRRSARPVQLLVLALLASGAANAWLWQDRQRAVADAKSATGKLAAAEAAQKELAQKDPGDRGGEHRARRSETTAGT